MKEKKLELKKTIEMIKENTYERKNRKTSIPDALILQRTELESNPKCQALGKLCNDCGKKGQFARVCKQREL